MKRVLLAGLLLLALALGVGGGYYTGDRLDTPEPTAEGTAGPLGEVTPSPSETPSESPLPVKTPVPNNLEPLETGLEYARRTFTVDPKDFSPVQLAVDIPQGWRLTRDPKAPGEVKFLDKLRERGVRVESDQPASMTPADHRAQLVIDLKKSQAPENDVRILSETDNEQILGDDGQPRTVSTLIYTFIPGETVRYVIVRWIAMNDNPLATVEMSITGLPQDADGLAEVLQHATTSVHEVS
ncbi:hypothetical protein [Kribbella sp. NPDC004875]|uniref:hypothetical protein n=1 Tax=Kribbella sp. NPDC004875 TaxID=3364107 RepID=UPI0036A60147